MGYIQKGGNPVGPRLMAAGKAIGDMAQVPMQYQKAQQELKDSEIRQKQAQLALDEQRSSIQLLSTKQLNDRIAEGFFSEDKKGFFKLHEGEFTKLIERSNSKLSPAEIQTMIEYKDPLLQQALKDMQTSGNFLMVATPGTQSIETFKTQVEKGTKAYDTAIAKLSGSLQAHFRDGKQKFLGYAEKVRDAFTKREGEIGFQKSAESRANTLASGKAGQRDEISRRKTIDAFNKDKIVQKFQEQLGMAGRAKNLAQEAKTNPLAASALIRALARASGEVGVLTDQDVNAFGGSQALKARLERAAKKAAVGKLPTEDLEYVNKLTAAMEKSIGANIRTRAELISKQQATAQTQYSKDELMDLYGFPSEPTGPTDDAIEDAFK